MTARRSVVAVAVMSLLAMLVPATALAETSQSFNAQVYAQNLPMYSFTIDNDHIEYYNPSNAALGVESAKHVSGDHDIVLSNTGAMGLEIMVVASSEPTASLGGPEVTVPLATDAYDNAQSANTAWENGGTGKMAWWWGRLGNEAGFYPDAGLVSTAGNTDLGMVAKGSSATLSTEVWTPTHWPHDTALDYNWGGTILAYTVDPV